MPLREQPLPITFSGGIETLADEKGVPSTRLLDLQNAQFTRRTTLSKRNGYRALSRIVDQTGQEYADAQALATRGDELVLFAGGRAYSHRTSTDRWSLTGEVSSVVARAAPIARTGTAQAMPDVAVNGGVQVAAWEDSRGGVWCSVLEEATGRVLLAQHQLAVSGISPRCVAVDQVLLVLWAVPADRRIWCARINPAAPADAPVSGVLTEDLAAANPVYDAEACGPGFMGDQEPAALAWALDGGGYRIGYLHASGVIGSPVTGLPSAATISTTLSGAIGLTCDRYQGASIAVVYCDGVSARVAWHDADDLPATSRAAAIGSSLASAERVACCFGRALAGGEPGLWWAVQEAGARTDLSLVRSGVTSEVTAAYDADETVLRGHSLLSRAWYDGPETRPELGVSVPSGDVYVLVAHAVRLFPYAAAIRLSAAAGIAGGATTIVARLMVGAEQAQPTHLRRVAAGADGFAVCRHVSSVVEVGRGAAETVSRRHGIPISYRVQLDAATAQWSEVGIAYAVLDFDHAASYQTAALGRGLYLASAAPQHYDGDRWAEADYHAAPDWGLLSNGLAYSPADAAEIVTGGGVDEGVHLYKVWYEDVDAQGEIHRGPTSTGVLVTTTATHKTVRLTIPTYRGTNKRRVRIGVARSAAGATGEDETIPLYRVTSLDPSEASGENRYVTNDPTVDSVSLDDALSDADLIGREPLYTNGGVLPNDPAPWAGDVIAAGKSRLFWTDPMGRDLVRYSKPLGDGSALEASVALSLQIDPAGGDITGIAVLDGAVCVFREEAIYAFGGAGPLAAPDVDPQVNSWTPAELVTSDVGLQGPAAPAPTPVGIMFKSGKGVALLGRDRQVRRDVGAPVDGYRSQRVVRTTLLPDRPHLVLLTDDGRTLLLDYERGQWSTWTNHEGLDAVVAGGVYHYLRLDGRVFAETPGQYADDNAPIPMAIETAWIKMSEYLQGLQSILWAYFLGRYLSEHVLEVRFRLDYGERWSAPIDLDVDANRGARSAYGDGPYGAGPFGAASAVDATLYQRRVHLNQICEAIQFKIVDREPSGARGASFELSELLLIGGVLGPKNPLGAGRSS